MRINNNALAINAYRNLSATNTSLGKALEKLSSGYRINRAADDAAGLVISQGLRAQISGLKQATRNAQDGISVVQTAEGALNEVHAMLERVRTLAVQAANTGANSTEAREALQAEVDQLAEEITRIGQSTKFGDVSLLDGSFNEVFQVGAKENETISLTIGSVVGDAGTAVDGVDLVLNAAAAITILDDEIKAVSELRGELGAKQNRLESVINNLNVTVENLTASESRIRDTDMAQEMTTFTRNQILSQAGTAMLAQANQVPQTVLSLLR